MYVKSVYPSEAKPRVKNQYQNSIDLVTIDAVLHFLYGWIGKELGRRRTVNKKKKNKQEEVKPSPFVNKLADVLLLSTSFH